nr:M23 family metallopeptidase [Romeria gracilis]
MKRPSDWQRYSVYQTSSEPTPTPSLPGLRTFFSVMLAGGLLSLGSLGLNQIAPQALRLEAAKATTETQVAARPGTAYWSSASFPVENFQAYTSAFGYRQSPYGGEQFHYGLDIAAPQGSYIRNWWEGRVVEVSDDSACGTSIVIESGDWTHIYCHMQGYVTQEGRRRSFVDREGGLHIVEGQDMPAGARIGRVGMTGRTTGPHLHWGLKYQNDWVDPGIILQAMYDDQETASR